MKKKKKHGENMSIEIKTKAELLEALHREASKPVDELDAVEIDRLTRLLEQYDEDKHTYTSDYEEFLQRFNDRNNTSLISSATRKKQERGIKILQITKRRRCGVVAAAMIMIALVVSAQGLSIASVDKSGSNWVTLDDGWVRFHIENSKYESWVEEPEEETTEYVQGNPNVIKFQSEQYSTNNINEVKQFNIMVPEQLPEGYDVDNITIMDLDRFKGTIDINYKKDKDNWISYTAELKDSQNAYEWALRPDDGSKYIGPKEFSNFTAHVFQNDMRIKVYFCCDGVVYIVSGTTSLEEMYNVLENVAYPE